MILLSFSRDSIWWNFYKCNCYVRVIGVSSTASNIQFHSWHTLQVRVCMYIWDCTWARPTMRACIELFILARKKKRKRKEKERERERDIQRLLSHSRLCLLLCLCCLFYLLNSLFFLICRGRDPCIPWLPVLPWFFFSFHPYIQVVIRSRSNEWKSQAPWPSAIHTCHVVIEKISQNHAFYSRCSVWQDSICDNFFE